MSHGLFYWCPCYVFGAVKISVALLSMEGQKALGFHQKYLNLCSEDERRSCGFGTTWGWVINDRIFIFGWTIPLSEFSMCEWETTPSAMASQHQYPRLLMTQSGWNSKPFSSGSRCGKQVRPERTLANTSSAAAEHFPRNIKIYTLDIRGRAFTASVLWLVGLLT